jgi:hypothetical protein
MARNKDGWTLITSYSDYQAYAKGEYYSDYLSLQQEYGNIFYYRVINHKREYKPAEDFIKSVNLLEETF